MEVLDAGPFVVFVYDQLETNFLHLNLQLISWSLLFKFRSADDQVLLLRQKWKAFRSR